MKIISNTFLYILILSLISCQSSKNFTDNDIVSTKTEVREGIRTTGVKTKFDDFNISTDITEFTRYEAVYYIKDGKDTVELKPVTYKKESKVENIKKEEVSKTTSDTKKEELNDEFVDKTIIKKEFKGYDLLKSIIGGVIAFFIGPFKFILWIVAILLIIPIYKFIKRLLTKKENNI